MNRVYQPPIMFEKLFQITRDFNIWNYAEEEEEEYENSTSPIFKILFKSNSNEKCKSLNKQLIKDLNQWNEYLDKELEDSRYSHEKLKNLRTLVKKIIKQSKLLLLKIKVKSIGFESNKINEKIKKFEIFLKRIYVAYAVEFPQKKSEDYFSLEEESPINRLSFSRYRSSSISPQSPIFDSTSPQFNFESSPSGIFGAHQLPFGSPPLTFSSAKKTLSCSLSKEILKIIAESNFKKLKKREKENFLAEWREIHIEKIKNLTPEKKPKSWGKSLLSVFYQLDTIKEIQFAANALSYEQMAAIFENCKTQDIWKLILCFVFAKTEVLEEFLTNIKNQNSFGKFYYQLIESSEKKRVNQEWLNRRLLEVINNFKIICDKNEDSLKVLIDSFKKIEPHTIRSENIKEIDDVKRKLKDACKNCLILKKLLTSFLTSNQGLELLNNIIQRYKICLKCLIYNENQTKMHPQITEKKENSSPQNIYEVINDLVFETADFTPEEDAYFVFASWGLGTPDLLFQNKLLGPISVEEYEKIKNQSLNSTKPASYFVNKAAIEFLESINIKTIADLQRLRIYNAELLKDYITTQLMKKAVIKGT